MFLTFIILDAAGARQNQLHDFIADTKPLIDIEPEEEAWRFIALSFANSNWRRYDRPPSAA